MTVGIHCWSQLFADSHGRLAEVGYQHPDGGQGSGGDVVVQGPAVLVPEGTSKR
jgi:hypothetical protein